jgi:hypothetical protein
MDVRRQGSGIKPPTGRILLIRRDYLAVPRNLRGGNDTSRRRGGFDAYSPGAVTARAAQRDEARIGLSTAIAMIAATAFINAATTKTACQSLV